MKDQEACIAWTPLPNLRGEFELVTLLDDEDGLHLTLKNDTGRRVAIDFRSVLGYRLTGRAVAPVAPVAPVAAAAPIPSGWLRPEVFSGELGVFFRLENSAWIAAAPEQQSELSHFVFVLSGEVIEVLSDEQPNVAWWNSLFGDAV